MFLKKSAQEVIRDAAIYLSRNTPITNFTAGSIARSIVESIAPEIGTTSDESRLSLYDVMQEVLDQGVISKATYNSLDLIGGLFTYPRRTEQVMNSEGVLVNELIDDDTYRYELTQVVPAAATANYAALRLACLTISGVQDIIGKEYSHGTGSFSFMLIVEYGFDEQSVLNNMLDAIKKVKAYGVRPSVMLPISVPVVLTIKLAFRETATDQQKTYARFEVQNKLQTYFGGFNIGQGVIYNDIVQEIMNADDKIVDFEILQMSLNNEPVLLTNHTILDDERIALQTITVN